MRLCGARGARGGPYSPPYRAGGVSLQYATGLGRGKGRGVPEGGHPRGVHARSSRLAPTFALQHVITSALPKLNPQVSTDCTKYVKVETACLARRRPMSRSVY